MNNRQQYYTSGRARATNLESYTHKLRAKIKELEVEKKKLKWEIKIQKIAIAVLHKKLKK